MNKVQLDIRKGHAQTVEKVLRWLDEEGGVKGVTICDSGCGTGACAASRGAGLKGNVCVGSRPHGCSGGAEVQR